MLRYPLCINAQKLVKLIKFSNEWAMQTVPRYRKESLPAASKKKEGGGGGESPERFSTWAELKKMV